MQLKALASYHHHQVPALSRKMERRIVGAVRTGMTTVEPTVPYTLY